ARVPRPARPGHRRDRPAAGRRPAAGGRPRLRGTGRGGSGVPAAAGRGVGAVGARVSEGVRMNVDIAALRAIERDRDIPFETVIEAIETALLTAYKHTDGHQSHARIDIDRKSGLVRVLATETREDGTTAEWDDTPDGFGRIAATTARQVILQRLRDAEHERTYGEFAAKEGELIAGVVQRDA